eukprot:TRINITY_DN7973_c0_g1_i1.p2 TRINITY_DN7973_c0_g1~~TRINITY_DN7973_c0_g1_i1.p2  ORF type:complete len:304 (-),score=125.72 TRINITY_DN7973_c0_g1_i1:91-1002(-)
MAAPLDTTHWEKDDDITKCNNCALPFSFTERKHHCRVCGKVFCDDCSFLRGPSELSPNEPLRQCSPCFIDYAFKATGVSKEPPTERQPPAKGDWSTPGKFKKTWIGNSYEDEEGHTHHSKGAIPFDPSEGLDCEGCHLEGLEKGGNGRATIKYSYIFADDAIQITGNCELDLYNCVVVGTDTAITVDALATLTAKDCYFIATGVPQKKRGCAILAHAGAKVTLENCVVAGSSGVLLKSMAKLKAKKGMISSQKTKVLSALLSQYYAISGDFDIDDVKVKGPTTKNNNDLPPRAKLTGSAVKAV